MSKPSRVAPTLMVLAVASQVLALLVWGHIAYLWVQGIEALAASVALTVFGLRYRRGDPGRSRWPPLLPLAAIALTGGIKDLHVALGGGTPIWVIVGLFASIAWFIGSSWGIWRTGARAITQR